MFIYTPIPQYNPTSTDNPGIPSELRAIDQWLAYRTVVKPNGKVNKPPINARTGEPGSSTDPRTWSSYDVAVTSSPVGAGFVLTPDDPYFAIDLDSCVNVETGAIEPWAQAVIDRIPTYWEVSYSGTGLRAIGRGVLPGDRNRTGDIETYDASRYVIMTGRTLVGHTTIRNCQASLTTWYREIFPPEALRPDSQPVSLNLDDNDIVTRLRSQRRGVASCLLDGDLCGKSSPSEARFALANCVCFYTGDVDQVARILLASPLWSEKDSDRDRDRKAKHDSRQAIAKYSGPRYSQQRHTTNHTAVVETSESDTCGLELIAARQQIRELCATIAERDDTIQTLRIRAHLADERESIGRNVGLGAARTTAAALSSIFREDRPRTDAPNPELPFRLPLAKLAERTGQSEDTCSRQLKQLAGYLTPTGAPVLRSETFDIPSSVDPDTGEITTRHREIWVAPGVEPTAFGYLIANLSPTQAPKHGGTPDRNACPDHPFAGVIRRTRTTRRVTRECAHCNIVLDVTIVPIGTPTAEVIPAATPTQHHAFGHENEPANPGRPIPHVAASIGSHRETNPLYRNMRHRAPNTITIINGPDRWTT
jgi:hypothetical protein